MQVIGIDEVGRGSIAGPLVVGALRFNKPYNGVLKDSKKLTPVQRLYIFNKLKPLIDYELGWVWPDEIDCLGMTKSLRLGALRALKFLDTKNCRIIIDGNFNFLKEIRSSEAIIKADETIAECSAASIAAKVTRDLYMTMMSRRYNLYNFHENAGYGTKYHLSSLKVDGPCYLHRLSFMPLKLKYI